MTEHEEADAVVAGLSERACQSFVCNGRGGTYRDTGKSYGALLKAKGVATFDFKLAGYVCNKCEGITGGPEGRRRTI